MFVALSGRLAQQAHVGAAQRDFPLRSLTLNLLD